MIFKKFYLLLRFHSDKTIGHLIKILTLFARKFDVNVFFQLAAYNNGLSNINAA